MIKKLRFNKGFTLVEVLLAIALIAAIALPLLSVFLQSVKTQRVAQGILSANYTSQDYVEKLDTQIYETVLSGKPSRLSANGYYLTAVIEPYGAASAMFSGACEYAHIVFYSDGRMLAVMPDGKWRMYSSIPESISLSAGGGTYSFTGGSSTISGSTSHTSCALLINAMVKPAGSQCSIALSSSCKALYYCRGYNEDDVSISGTTETYTDLITGESSLIRVKTYVYEMATAANPVATSESYINIRNWE
jgi:prepilin-type N-terminal cleavage/methylation domain-containing protein